MDASLLFSGRHGVPTVSGLGCSKAAIGYWQKKDVNAFAMERFHNKNTLACELQKYSKITGLYLKTIHVNLRVIFCLGRKSDTSLATQNKID